MSENLVHIDAGRLLQWGIDAYERGRAEGERKARQHREETVPVPVVTDYRIERLVDWHRDDPTEPTAVVGPHRITVTLSDGSRRSGVFQG